MTEFIHLAAYKFVPLADLAALRERLLACGRAGGLKGTILLSPEGINFFFAGEATHADGLLKEIRTITGLADLVVKESQCAKRPYERMQVKIKKEIIAFGVEGIDPARRSTPKLPPLALKQWLDEGRPFTLLDTRNNYEIQLGTFRGAHSVGIEHFREFPDAVRRLPVEMKSRPVVMFCTGGIRCEKAGPFLEREGFQSVFQLDGGILGYFENCGGAHYQGECFVFDQRVGLDPALRETHAILCTQCQMPLTIEDQGRLDFVPGKSCRYCAAGG